jgi:pimeloyl-ACP methyl ester carboxylesterase
MELQTAQRIEHGLAERRFVVERDGSAIPGMLWTRDGAIKPAPLVLVGHGGTGSKDSFHVLLARDYFTTVHGIAVAAIDGPAHGDRIPAGMTAEAAAGRMWDRPDLVESMVSDWQATLDALLALGEFDGNAIGYYGVSMGAMFGIPFVAAEPRISTAAMGLCALRGPSLDRRGEVGVRFALRLAESARAIHCAVMFHVQWDDENFERESAIELHGLFGTEDKRLQSTPGPHGGMSAEARDSLNEFMARRLELLHQLGLSSRQAGVLAG